MKKQLIIISIFLIISFYNTQAAEYIQAHNKTWDNQVANPDLGGAVFVTSKNILNFTMQKPAGDDSTKCYVYKNATAHGTTDYIYTSTYSGVYCAINGNLTINTAYIFVSTKDFSTNYNQKYTGNLVGLLPVYDNSGRWDMGILDNGANNAFGFITYFFCLEKLIFTVADEQPLINKDSLFIVIDKNSSTNNSVWFNISHVGNFSFMEAFNNSNLLYNGSNNFLNVTGIGNNTQVNFNITGRWNYTLYNNTYFNLTSGQTEQYIAPETFKINISWASPTDNFNHTQYTFVDYNFTVCCDSSKGSDCTVNVSIDPTEKHILTNGSGTVINNILTINTWDTMHDAVVGTEAILNNWELYTYNFVLDEGQINRIFLAFNTSVLPDNAIISDAKLYFHVSNSGGGNIYLVGETKQESTSNLIIADFDQCGAIDNPVLMADTVAPVENSWSYFTLNSNGINNISKTGITKFGIRSYYDYSDTDPSDDIELYTIDNSDIYLNITYTIPEEESNATSKGLINTTSGDLPFYTTDNNPQNSLTVADGSCDIVSFSVNATGTLWDSYQFFGNISLANNYTMNYGTNVINITIIEEDSCTYQGSGIWTILCSDNCIITQTVDLEGNTILITGEGLTTFTYQPVNFNKMSIHGDSASNICRVRIT